MTHTPPEGHRHRRARVRPDVQRSAGAFRFTGVGRHCVLSSDIIDEHLIMRQEPVAPMDTDLAEPMTVDVPQDIDIHEDVVFDHPVDDEFDVAPGGTSTLAVVPGPQTLHADDHSEGFEEEAHVARSHDHWLEQARAEIGDVADHHLSFAEAVAQHYGDVPPGYLPAEDLFSQNEADLTERRKRRKRRRINLVTVVVVLALVVGAIGFALNRALNQPDPDYQGSGEGKVTVTIEQGWTARQIGEHLEKRGVVMSADTFVKRVGQQPKEPVFQPGAFQLKKEMSSKAAISGLTADDDVTYFALPSNVRLKTALTEISTGTHIPREELESLANEPERFGLPKEAKNIEGYLHPGDYRFPTDVSAEKVLSRMIGDTKQELEKNGVTDSKEQFRTLKIASIVAGEAPQKDYKHVAGILENRLDTDNEETSGYLQLDSTVAYGLDKTTVHLSKDELKEKDNRYNTYVHKGLPPTPIGSPGTKAITAAAKPDKNKDYYWVTVNLSTGKTKFARTNEQHERYVKEYREWCKDHPDECNA